MPESTNNSILQRLRGGLVVSCQARGANPLAGPTYMLAMARAAVMGGAACVRIESPEDIRAVVRAVDVPVIGLYKVDYPNSPVYITPTLREVELVVACGAQIVAIDATQRVRPEGDPEPNLRKALDLVHSAGRLAMADISTIDEAVTAAAMGFDIVGTTLSGYTPYSPQMEGPDLALVESAVQRCSVPVIAEGRFWEPAMAVEALELGAWAVTVGTAITNPVSITQRFVTAMRQ